MGHQGRELGSLTQAWAQDSWDLLDQRLWSQKVSYFWASLLFVLSFFIAWVSTGGGGGGGIPCLGQGCRSLGSHTGNLGWGVDLSLVVPEKRLSFWGL